MNRDEANALVRQAAALIKRIVDLPDEWDEEATKRYYAKRHSGDIGYEGGFEDGWHHASDLLRQALLDGTQKQ